VAHLDTALTWYERLFGRPPGMRPDESEAVWHLTSAGSVYAVRDADRAGTAILTIAVEDLDLQVAQLSERGLTVVIEQGGNGRAVVADLEGNEITFFKAWR
jgi:hypothetical protein